MAGETVWVIDDDGDVRGMLDAAFSRIAKYETRIFPTASEALDVLANGGQAPDAILCDYFGAPRGQWPGMHIDAFYSQAAPYLEGTHRYGMTRATDENVAKGFVEMSRLGLRRTFKKPFPDLPEVVRAVQQGFAERRGSPAADDSDKAAN